RRVASHKILAAMKRVIRSTRPGLGRAGIVVLSLIVAARSTMAAQPNEATITQLVNDVQLGGPEAALRSASINDKVRDGSRVQAGLDSRTELTFASQAVARLSANTIFSFNQGTRNLDLASGAVLVRVPNGSGTAKIST